MTAFDPALTGEQTRPMLAQPVVSGNYCLLTCKLRGKSVSTKADQDKADQRAECREHDQREAHEQLKGLK